MSWHLLAPFCLALLFESSHGITPRRAAWRGFLFGCGMMGVGVSWVQVSVHQFGLPSYWFSTSVTVLFVLGLASFPALVGYLVARLRLGADLAGSIAFAGLWTLSEWLRGWLLTGFPWLLAGYSQVDSPLAGYAPVLGVLGVSFAVAMIGAMLVMLRNARATRARAMSLAGLVSVVIVGYLLERIDWSQPAGEPLRAALVQGNVAQSAKWQPEKRDQTLESYRNLSEPYWGHDVIVWPETAIPAFPQEVSDFLEQIDARANATGTTFLTGIPTWPPQASGYRNSVVALGAQSGRYDKRHLVPFGEYLPLRGLLGPILDFLSVPMSDFQAGDSAQKPLEINGHPAGISICYEDAYSGEIRRALPDAALLVNVSNDAWFGDSLAPHQHLEIARMRAIEFRRYLLRATNTGISAIIDAHGRIVARSPQFTATTVTGEVVPLRGATPLAVTGNLPIVLLALSGLTPALWRRGFATAKNPGL